MVLLAQDALCADRFLGSRGVGSRVILRVQQFTFRVQGSDSAHGFDSSDFSLHSFPTAGFRVLQGVARDAARVLPLHHLHHSGPLQPPPTLNPQHDNSVLPLEHRLPATLARQAAAGARAESTARKPRQGDQAHAGAPRAPLTRVT
eukprot:2448956-Rhodomonas_salina.2